MAIGSTRQRVQWRDGRRGEGRCAGWQPELARCWLPPFRRAPAPVSTATMSAAAAQPGRCILVSTVWSAAPRPPAHRAELVSARSRAIATAPVPALAGVAARPATGATTAQPAAPAGVAISGRAPERSSSTRRTLLVKELAHGSRTIRRSDEALQPGRLPA